MMPAEERGIRIYPVGILAALKHHQLKRELRYILDRVWVGHFWAVRNSFNGYLAEWDYPPNDMIISRCGHGWTRRSALRRLGKQIVYDNLSECERD